TKGIGPGIDLSAFLQGITATTAAELVDQLAERLGPVPINDGSRAEMAAYLDAPNGLAAMTPVEMDTKIRGLIHLILGTAEYQVYPKDGFSQALKLVAQIIVKDLGTKIFYVQISGFDTHANQANPQAKLLGQLGDGLAAFFTDVKNAGRADDLLVVTFSEFGRRVRENASKGTDHGAAGTMFVLGGRVRGGFHGGLPSLAHLDSGDLKYTVDFRSVYATVLEKWLGAEPSAILGQPFPLAEFV
ncbi:MAG TPA: DUF1501 domain-containing protein, partial [Candidatus Dormibacteraeota bacterium]|nr:DUF1501 domain-containing protein [Candidatus Dormibacteraeota bacterium]